MMVVTGSLFEKLCAHLGCDPAGFNDAYTLLRRKLVRFFDGNGCWEATELADETLSV